MAAMAKKCMRRAGSVNMFSPQHQSRLLGYCSIPATSAVQVPGHTRMRSHSSRGQAKGPV
jgi:hypothetical protein